MVGCDRLGADPKARPAGALECVSHIRRRHGLKGFFRGGLAPIATRAPIQAMAFSTNGALTRLMKAYPGKPCLQ